MPEAPLVAPRLQRVQAQALPLHEEVEVRVLVGARPGARRRGAVGLPPRRGLRRGALRLDDGPHQGRRRPRALASPDSPGARHRVHGERLHDLPVDSRRLRRDAQSRPAPQSGLQAAQEGRGAAPDGSRGGEVVRGVLGPAGGGARAGLQMDTVMGSQPDSKCVLTLYVRPCSFQFCLLLEDRTAQAVEDALGVLERAAGAELFRRLFGLVLTDNGSEFSNPEALEGSALGGGPAPGSTTATPASPSRRAAASATTSSPGSSCPRGAGSASTPWTGATWQSS